MDLDLYLRNKTSQALPKVLNDVLDGTYNPSSFCTLIQEPDYERLDPMYHILDTHTNRWHMYCGNTLDMFRALFNLIDTSNDRFQPKEDARIKLLINFQDAGVFPDAFENQPIIEYLNNELEQMNYVDGKHWASQNLSDISALFNIPTIKTENLYAGYIERKDTFCIFIKTTTTSLNNGTSVKYLLSDLFIQLQAVIVALYPHFVPETYHSLIEREYNHRFTDGRSPLPDIEEYAEHYEFIPRLTGAQAIEEMLLEEAEMAEKDRIERLQNEIESATVSYEDMCFNLDRLSFTIQSKKMALLTPEITREDYKSMASSISVLPEIQHMEFTRSGSNTLLRLYIRGKIDFDPELLNRTFLGNDYAFKFFKGIQDGDFESYFSGLISVRTDQCNPTDGKLGINLKDNPLSSKVIAISNPHLAIFGCMGSNKDAISRARAKHNWVGVALQCINMVRGINLADSTVINRFVEYYLSPRTASRNLMVYPKEGRAMHWLDYYQSKYEGKEL